MEKLNLVYFKNLNGLRAVAAILVIFTHVDLIRKKLGLPVYNKSSFLNFPIGSLAVTFFFVLSGFLISYLLLNEEQRNSKINVRKFYFRRILKIWPLYFLLTFIGFIFLISQQGIHGLLPSLICYFLILPNLSAISNPLCFQSWSIGVEEQFYLVWPLIINKKSIVPISLTIVISFFIFRTIPEIFALLKINCPEIFSAIRNFILENRFDSMAIGALLAHLQFNNLIKYKFSIKQEYLFYFILFLFFLISNKLYYGTQHFIFSILFAVYIYFQIIDLKGNRFLESNSMKYLGKISYGIYMWHIVAIYISIQLCDFFMTSVNHLSFSYNVILYVASIAITIIISALSFELYESYFIKIKHSFYKA